MDLIDIDYSLQIIQLVIDVLRTSFRMKGFPYQKIVVAFQFYQLTIDLLNQNDFLRMY